MPPHLEKVRDKLAENIHELWGMNKIELGWTYGKVRHLFQYFLQFITLKDKKACSMHFFHICQEINIRIAYFKKGRKKD